MSIPKANLNKPTNITDDEKENELNLPNCKYRNTGYFKNLTKDFRRSFLFPYECLLTYKNFDDFNILLSELNVSFDILAIAGTRIKKDPSSSINLQLNIYSTEHTPTESSGGGTFPVNNLRQISYSQLKVLSKNYFFNSYNQISV